jgi:dsDNA-specific endonuclease/ATPase MutS2
MQPQLGRKPEVNDELKVKTRTLQNPKSTPPSRGDCALNFLPVSMINRGAKDRPPAVTVHAQPSDEATLDEINVIGTTVEEATRRVDKFLDEAALAGKPSVRIIHGHGTGALRRGLAEFLSSHPLVERIHAEADNRGGTAIAELKG